MPERRDDPLVTMGEQNPAWDEIDGECIDLPDAVAAEAARLEKQIEEDRERWARHYDLLAPLPAVFVNQDTED